MTKKATTADSRESVHTLLGHTDMKIIQRKDIHPFSIVSALLADFASLRKNTRVVVDFGTGFAPVPLFLSKRSEKIRIHGIEINSEAADIAKRNVKLNGLEERIFIIEDDLKNASAHFPPSSVDLVTCNPPFFPHRDIEESDVATGRTIASREVTTDIRTIARVAASILKNKGCLSLVHRSERIDEVFKALGEQRLYPKRIRFVHPRIDAPATTVLIEALHNTAPGVTVLPPLIVHNESGYTEEVERIFCRKRVRPWK